MAANLRLVENSIWLNEQKATHEPIRKQHIEGLLLISDVPLSKADETAPSYKMLAMVIAAHCIVLAAILSARPDVQAVEMKTTPMMVSLVNSPSPVEPQVTPTPQQPEIVEVPKKPEQKAEQSRALTELPAKEQATAKTVVSEPVEQPVVAEAAASENPVKAEQPVQVADAPAKAEAEPMIEPPKFGAAYLNNPAPTYPSLSRRSGEQGRVLLKVLVSENGLAESVQLDSSSGYEKLDRAAIEAVKKWSFVPAKRSNQPVSAYVLVPVKFSLSS
ncbi:MAG TPA: energy transducer TonB [Methylotenera sp.]